MARLRESIRALSNMQLQEWAENTMCELRRTPGVGGLSGQHLFGVALQLGTLTNARLCEFSAPLSSSAVYAGRRTFTPSELKALLLAVAAALRITSAQAENAACEATRKREVTDLAMANTCLIGNPRQSDGFGPANFVMQRMRLDTGEWEPIPPVIPKSTGRPLLEEVKANILNNADMPVTVNIKHSDDVKAAALKAYYVVEIEPTRGNSSYEACVDAIATYKPEESHRETMARCQAAVEAHIGCPLRDRTGVESRVQSNNRRRARDNMKRRTKRRAQARAAVVGAEEPNPAALVGAEAVVGAEEPNQEALVGDEEPNQSGPAGTGSNIDRVPAVVGPRHNPVPIIAADTAEAAGDLFEATKPAGVTSITQINSACCGTAALELYGQASAILKANGALPPRAKNLSAKDVECTEASWRHRRGGNCIGYYSACSRLGLDYSQYSCSFVAASISRDLFGGLRVLDSGTLKEKMVFKNKAASVRCFLFLTVLLKGREHNEAAVAMVARLFGKTCKNKETRLWEEGHSASLRLVAQGCNDCCLGYLVVRGRRVCWYAYEAMESPSAGRPQLRVIKLAQYNPSRCPLRSKRASRRLERAAEKRARREASGKATDDGWEWDCDSWTGDDSGSVDSEAQTLLALLTDAGVDAGVEGVGQV